MLMSFNEYKARLEKAFLESYELELNIKYDIKLRLLPYPRLILEEVSIRNHNSQLLHSNSVQINLSWLKFLTNNSEIIDSVELSNGEIFSIEYLAYLKENYQSLQNTKIKKLTLHDFKFINGKSTITNNEDFFATIKVALFNVNYESDNKITLHTDLYIGNAISKIDVEIEDFLSDQGKFTLKSVSDDLEFSLISTKANLKDLSQAEGKVSINIKDLNLLHNRFSKSHVSSQYVAKTKLFKENTITINSDFILYSEVLSFINIQFLSEAVKNMNGNIIIDYSNRIQINSQVKVEEINLNNIIDNDAFSKKYLKKGILKSTAGFILDNFHFFFPSYFTGLFDFHIDKTIILNDSVDHLKLSMDVSNGTVSLSKFSIIFPGNLEFVAQGIMSHNDIRPKFEGNFSVKTQNLAKFLKWLNYSQEVQDTVINKLDNTLLLKSNVLIIPYRIKLRSINAAIGEIILAGDTTFIKDSYNSTSIYNKFYFNKIDLDLISGIEWIEDQLAILYAADYDVSSDSYFKLTENYKYLRSFEDDLHLEIVIDQLTAREQIFSNVNSVIDISNNNIEVSNLQFDSNFAQGNCYFLFSLPAFRPYIKAKVNFSKLDQELWLNMFSSLWQQLEKKSIINSSINSQDKNNVESKTKNFNFLSAKNYDADLKVSIIDISNNPIDLQNLKFALNLNNGIVSLSEAKAKLFNGDLALIGRTSLIEALPQVELSFSLSNVDPQLLLSNLVGINNMSGYLSLNGLIASSGNNLGYMLDKLKGEVNFIGKRIDWSGFTIDEIIRAVESQGYSITEKAASIDYYSKYGSSFFDNVQGNVKISNGIANVNNVNISNNRITGIYAANINLINKDIASVAKLSFIPIGYTNPLTLDISSSGKLNDINSDFDTKTLIDFINKNAQKTSDDKQSKPNNDTSNTGKLLNNRNVNTPYSDSNKSN